MRSAPSAQQAMKGSPAATENLLLVVLCGRECPVLPRLPGKGWCCRVVRRDRAGTGRPSSSSLAVSRLARSPGLLGGGCVLREDGSCREEQVQ